MHNKGGVRSVARVGSEESGEEERGRGEEATHAQPPVFFNQRAHGAVSRGPAQTLPIEQMDRHGVCSILCSRTSQFLFLIRSLHVIIIPVGAAWESPQE